MNYYVKELIECGLSFDKAIRIYHFFLKECGTEELETYILIMKGRDDYVETI